MSPVTRVLLGGALTSAAFLFNASTTTAQALPERLVRIAEVSIDPPQLEAYKAALSEEIKASIRNEPGVLTLYAVTLKDHPSEIRLFEIYANVAAYQAHLQSKHFLKYKTVTAGMVKSLRLIEADPLILRNK